MIYIALILSLISAVGLFAGEEENNAGEFIYSAVYPVEILNSGADEFAPSYDLYKNLLYYNSTRSKYSCFYVSAYSDGQFTQPQLLAGDINKARNNQSYITLIDENQAVYSSFSQKSDHSVINLFSIFCKNGKWNDPVLLDSISGNSFSAEPTVAPSDNYMVFVSDRGHFGETDLWSATLQDNGRWGELFPIENLNSPGNEMSPFLCGNDTLYFASDGLGGPGGYDIYRSIRVNGVWQRPFPLADINTEFDESDFIIINDTLCLFSSNRSGGLGGFDIYSAIRSNKQNMEIEDTDFDLSLFSTVHLVNVNYKKNIYYLLENNEIIEKSDVMQKFSPDDLDMQMIIRPDGSFISAKVELSFNNKIKKSIPVTQSTSDYKIDLDEVLGNELPDAEDVLIIVSNAISKANFSISKKLEINFSRKEEEEKQPYSGIYGNFGVISILTDAVSPQEITAISTFLHFKNATDIHIYGNNSDAVAKLYKSLSANGLKNVKADSDGNFYKSNSKIEVYFR